MESRSFPGRAAAGEPGEASFVALGGTEEISASCHYVHVDGTGLLLDAGSDPELEGPGSLPSLDLIRGRADRWVDHAVVTHAHHDHLGSLPVVVRSFPHVLVHMTRATRDLAELLLPASARLQRKKLLEGSTPFQPLFEEEELGAHSYLYLTHELETPFDLGGIRGGTPVAGTLFDAGHVLGSAGLLLEAGTGSGTRRLFYTGDTNLRSQAVIPGASYPDVQVDTLILESTLGSDPEAELTTRRREEQRFGEALRAVLAAGGSVLIPVFALGRGQEVLALIDRFKRRGTIDSAVPVYSAGLMRAISEVYDRSRFYTPRVDQEFQLYGVDQERLPRSAAALANALGEPGIYVVGSGMMFERTHSNRLAQALVENERHAVFIVGFAREDSPAHRLLTASRNGSPEVTLEPMRGAQTVRCRVERFRFSGHSHRRDLLALVDRLKPGRVILVHGQSRSRAWMADNIRYFHPEVDIRCPAQGEEIPLWD